MNDKDKYNLRNMPQEELFNIIARHGTDTPIHQYALMEIHRQEDLTKEDRATQRHEQIHTQLMELKKPHWSVTPTFWLTLICAIAAITACVLTWIAWPKS